MKNFRMLATIVHCIGVMLAVMSINVAVLLLIPNHDMAWIIVVIMGSGAIATTWGFFLHDKYWYYSHEDLRKEIRKYQEARIKLEHERDKYVRAFEKNLNK